MKNIFVFIISCLASFVMQAQEIRDALHYSQDNLNGTARFRAMGGAFGALGGDLSSLNVNPAGSAVFSNNQFTLSLSSFNTKNNSNYFENQTQKANSNFDLNQTGGVFVFKNNDRSSSWKKFSLAVNYENVNDFDNSIFSAGVNAKNSIDQYFLSYANGISLGSIKNTSYSRLDNAAQQAFLGYEAFIINPVNDVPNNTQYRSNVTPGGNYYHENSILSIGSNGKVSFNAATSFRDKLYVGVNLNSHFFDYTQSSSFYESNTNRLGTAETVTSLTFKNDLYAYGTGFSYQIGALAKVTEGLRLGFAYNSATRYTISEEFSQKLTAVSANSSRQLAPDVIDPQITNFYEPYKLRTPSKITGSFAYIFGKSGLISIDYSLKDYRNIQFVPRDDSYFKSLNNQMRNTLKSTSEFRIGTEYRIKALSLRGGYRFEQSPFINATTIGNASALSGGLGYSLGSFKVDLSYTTMQRNTQQPFFGQGFTDSARINTVNNNFTMTLLFEL
jgi:long-subunit fatty acid transport protein